MPFAVWEGAIYRADEVDRRLSGRRGRSPLPPPAGHHVRGRRRRLPDGATLGRRWPRTPTYALRGDIAEVVVYSRVLTDTERGQVETYLHDEVAGRKRRPVPTGHCCARGDVDADRDGHGVPCPRRRRRLAASSSLMRFRRPGAAGRRLAGGRLDLTVTAVQEQPSTVTWPGSPPGRDRDHDRRDGPGRDRRPHRCGHPLHCQRGPRAARGRLARRPQHPTTTAVRAPTSHRRAGGYRFPHRDRRTRTETAQPRRSQPSPC